MIKPSSERDVNNDDYGKTAPRKNYGTIIVKFPKCFVGAKMQ
jgi:hypothetical protein